MEIQKPHHAKYCQTAWTSCLTVCCLSVRYFLFVFFFRTVLFQMCFWINKLWKYCPKFFIALSFILKKFNYQYNYYQEISWYRQDMLCYYHDISWSYILLGGASPRKRATKSAPGQSKTHMPSVKSTPEQNEEVKKTQYTSEVSTHRDLGPI